MGGFKSDGPLATGCLIVRSSADLCPGGSCFLGDCLVVPPALLTAAATLQLLLGSGASAGLAAAIGPRLCGHFLLRVEESESAWPFAALAFGLKRTSAATRARNRRSASSEAVRAQLVAPPLVAPPVPSRAGSCDLDARWAGAGGLGLEGCSSDVGAARSGVAVGFGSTSTAAAFGTTLTVSEEEDEGEEDPEDEGE